MVEPREGIGDLLEVRKLRTRNFEALELYFALQGTPQRRSLDGGRSAKRQRLDGLG